MHPAAFLSDPSFDVSHAGVHQMPPALDLRDGSPKAVRRPLPSAVPFQAQIPSTLNVGIVPMLHRAERELTHLLSLNQLTHINEGTAWVAAEAEAGLASDQFTGAAVPCVQSTRPNLSHGAVLQVRGVFPTPACLGCELVHK